MKKFLIFLFAFCGCCTVCCAQYTTLIAHSHIGGDASAAYHYDWVAFHTPASLATQQGVLLQASFENRYLTKELFNESMSLGLATKYLNVGVALAHFGYGDYHELLSGIAFARNFGNRLNIGIQVNYYALYFSELGRYRGAVTAQVGMQCRVVREFYLAFHVHNPTFSKIRTVAMPVTLPAIFSLGAMHIINEQVNWVAQVDKDVYGSWRWALGVEYAPFKEFAVRAGGYGQPFVPTLGVGLRFGEFRFNLHCEYHLRLGLCTTGGLSYRF